MIAPISVRRVYSVQGEKLGRWSQRLPVLTLHAWIRIARARLIGLTLT